MAKLVAKTSNKFWGVLGFELLGSIILLAISYSIGHTWSSGWQWWQTISLAIGTIGSLSLIFLTLANFAMINSLSRTIMRVAMITAVALVVIVAGNWSWVGLAGVGYVLVLIGSLWGMPRDM